MFTKVFFGGSNDGLTGKALSAFQEEMNDWFQRAMTFQDFNLQFVSYVGVCDSIGTAGLSALIVYKAIGEIK